MEIAHANNARSNMERKGSQLKKEEKLYVMV